MGPTVILKARAKGLKEDMLVRFISRACRLVGLKGAVTVLVTSDREMRILNLRFRGKNSPTDVLSFPSSLVTKGFAGDVAISLDIAARNARRLGHSVADEVRILALHGILHLAGYDHESDSGEMAGRESQLRPRLGLPDALIERVSPESRESLRPNRAKKTRFERGTRSGVAATAARRVEISAPRARVRS